ncbi:MAG: hypothetical protein ACREDV_02805, partial [Methylocella sp.]
MLRQEHDGVETLGAGGALDLGYGLVQGLAFALTARPANVRAGIASRAAKVSRDVRVMTICLKGFHGLLPRIPSGLRPRRPNLARDV